MKKIIIFAIFVIAVVLLASCNQSDGNVEESITSNSITTSEPNDEINSSSQEIQTEITTLEPTPTYTLTTYSNTDEYGNAGTYSVYQNTTVPVGQQVLLTATVNDGYNFVGWFIDDICISEDLTYNYSVTAKDVQIEALYNYYTVTTSSNTNDRGVAGTFTEMNHKKVSVGTSVTVSAKTNDGYNFVGWFLDDICVSEEPIFTFVMKEENIRLEAKYSSYTVSTGTFADNSAGSFTQLNEQKISVGETVTINANANEGYNFEGWYYWWSDICVSKDPTYTFTMTAEDVVLEARFSSYVLNVYGYTYEGMAGSITEHNEQKFSVGSLITLSATTQNGYNFEGWYEGSTCVSKDLTYSFTMPANDVSIEACYSCYKLSVYGDTFEGTAGSINEYNEEIIAIGDQVTLIATVNDGFNFDGWYINHICVSNDLEFVYIMKDHDEWIEAVYNFYTVSTSGYTYESMAGNFTQYHEKKISIGQKVTVTATVEEGYRFEGWFVNDICISTELSYTFIMKNQNIRLEARYCES